MKSDNNNSGSRPASNIELAAHEAPSFVNLEPFEHVLDLFKADQSLSRSKSQALFKEKGDSINTLKFEEHYEADHALEVKAQSRG